MSLQEVRDARKKSLLEQKQKLEAQLDIIQENSIPNEKPQKSDRKRKLDPAARLAGKYGKEEEDDFEKEENTRKKKPKKKTNKTESDPDRPKTQNLGIKKDMKSFKAMHKNVVYFKNFVYEYTDEDIKKCFESCGTVSDVHRILRASGQFGGNGYVAFSSEDAIDKALKKSKSVYGGRTIVVEIPKSW